MKLHRAVWRIYRILRKFAWSSPLAKNPFWAEIFVSIGYSLRRWLKLSWREDTISIVHDNKMVFGGASEVYGDMANDDYEPGVTRLFEKLIEPGMVIVDVGAHIGYYSLIAAKKTSPMGKVYSFEPAPSNYNILVKNIALNEYQNILPVQKAISDISGIASFFLHRDTVAHSLHPTTLGRGKKTIKVETASLDDFFEHESWPHVHLIKMDIEGAEKAALTGMAKLIEKNPKMSLLLEFVPQIQKNVGINPHDLINTIRTFGFTIQRITDEGLKPFDDKACDDLTLHSDLFCQQ